MMRFNNQHKRIGGILFCVSFCFLFLQNLSLVPETRNLSVNNNFGPLKDLSDFYDSVFAWDVDEKTQEIQKQIRINRECEPRPDLDTQPEEFDTDHPDSHITTISCVPVHYRIPTSSIKNIEDKVVYGVLSGHPVHGRERRDSVRKTWGKDVAAFYIVAGDWKIYEQEYNEQKDLLWIDQPEAYMTSGHNPRKGALTFKSEAFLVAMYDLIVKENPNVKHFFKTDDDCYVDTKLFLHLVGKLNKEGKDLDYGGSLMEWNRADRREGKNWYASYGIYPFTYIPPYATGGGWHVSSDFLKCAIGQGHIAQIPYFPLEDAAVGMISERCDIKPTRTFLVHYNIRKDTSVRHTVQHDVKDDALMIKLHETALLKPLPSK